MEEYRPYLPDDWGNDDKMTVLFSPFRENREINPVSWDAKMKFWTDMIEWELKYSNQAVIDVKQFPHRFKRNGKSPTCLNKVLNEMLRAGTIMKLSDYESNANMGWVSWGFGMLVKKPVSWAFSTAIGSYRKEPELDGEYVFVDIIKEKAKHVLDHHHRLTGSKTLHDVVCLNALRQQCREICTDERTFMLVLTQLKVDGKIVLIETQTKEKFVKFCNKSESRVKPVTDVDQSILRLSQREHDLLKEVETLYSDCEKCHEEARAFVKKGQSASAKTALRRKRTIQSVIDKREAALANIQNLLLQIRNAHSDKMTMDAYGAGSEALKSARKDGASLGEVDTLMAELDELMAEQAEFDISLAQGPSSNLDISMSDLEKELEDLELEDTDTGKENPVLPEVPDLLPSVPKFEPSYGSDDSALNSTFTLDDNPVDKTPVLH
ncbi:charged multivesicular body protein 7-like [Lineus longissimus]|uniref:charged multivesicular body protein 7-like n=1 Tax=Lineus longissimus TaxID=88925 RepID=UPI002B4CD23D